jgi:hypothetical protein
MRDFMSLLLAGMILCGAPLLCQTAAVSEGDRAWQSLRPLAGDWTGTGGGGEPGEVSASGMSFRYELQERVLVRKSFTAFRATASRAAFQHDDLTVIYRGDAGAPPRAIYFDDEGHSIEYTISVSSDGQRIECLSAARPDQPRFRFTYVFTGPDALKIRFEIAPPGQPERFTTHVEGSARRVAKK